MPSHNILAPMLFLFTVLTSHTAVAAPLLWPKPQHMTFNASAPPVTVSPCEVRYLVQSPLQPYIQNTIDFYLSTVFHCPSTPQSNYTLTIGVPASSVNLPLEPVQEAYSLIIRDSNKW